MIILDKIMVEANALETVQRQQDTFGSAEGYQKPKVTAFPLKLALNARVTNAQLIVMIVQHVVGKYEAWNELHGYLNKTIQFYPKKKKQKSP
jgi:hypothetical protein